MTAPTCPYCGEPARRASAADVYGPHRSQGFADRVFWHCQPCDAYVGTHPGTEVPLGTPAKAKLRKLRADVHAALDPLWRGSPRKRMRADAYAYLAQALGIDAQECHVGLFDEERCNAALSALRGVEVESIAGLADSARPTKDPAK